MATASIDIANPDLVDAGVLLPAGERYSYVFNGNAQTLDHVLVNVALLPQLAGVAHARVNADFPEIYRSDPSRPERLSDHDPVVGVLHVATKPDRAGRAPARPAPGAALIVSNAQN